MRASEMICVATVSALGLAAPGCGARRVTAGPSAEEIEWERCHDAERSDDASVALECYAALCRGDKPFTRACYNEIEVRLELGDVEAGRSRARAFAITFPDDALAPDAVELIVKSYIESKDYGAGASSLRELAAQLAGTELGDTALYQLARVCREAGDVPAEGEALEKIVETYDRWNSQLWDDALWRLVELARATGRAAREEQLLEKLESEWEPSRVVGSGDSPYHDDALMRLGELKAQRGDSRGALILWERVAGMAKSRLRDDALLAIARLRASKADRQGACSAVGEILGKLPGSSSERKAMELAVQLGCPHRAEK